MQQDMRDKMEEAPSSLEINPRDFMQAEFWYFRKSELRVGIFVLIGFFIFAFFYFFGKDFYQMMRPHKRVVAWFDQAGGIQVMSSVKIAGVPIGKVTGVKIVEAKDHRVEVNLKVFSDIPLRKGIVASVRATELVIGKYIELSGGDINAPLLKEGDIIHGSMEPSIEEVVNSAGTIIMNVKDIVSEINSIFSKNKIGELVANVNRIMEIVGNPNDNIIGNLQKAVKSINESGIVEDVISLLKVFAENRKRISELIANGSTLAMESNRIMMENKPEIQKMVKDISKLTSALSAVLDPNKAKKIIDGAETLVTAFSTNADQMAKDLSVITGQSKTLLKDLQGVSSDLPFFTSNLRNLLPKVDVSINSLNKILTKVDDLDEYDIRKFFQHEGMRIYLLENLAPDLVVKPTPKENNKSSK